MKTGAASSTLLRIDAAWLGGQTGARDEKEGRQARHSDN
jgi:hypothetical protein